MEPGYRPPISSHKKSESHGNLQSYSLQQSSVMNNPDSKSSEGLTIRSRITITQEVIETCRMKTDRCTADLFP